jgi:hypothetical protein
LIRFARDGRGSCAAIAPGEHAWNRLWLNRGQVGAVLHVLNSRDRVMLVRGPAGAGKTEMMQEVAEAVEASGRRLVPFAQSAAASRGVLRKEAGFPEAETVAMLLADPALQDRARGQLVWIDEASQLSMSDMLKVFALAERIDARVVLAGDRRQHGSVERGSVLRILEEEAGLRPAELREIQRQEERRYRQAVQALADGRPTEGFRVLDELGWIREIPTTERYRVLAGDYLDTVGSGRTALVVSPTRREGEWITQRIRAGLKQRGKLRANGRTLRTLESAQLTEAERADPTQYAPGDVLVFHQNARAIRKGERLKVGSARLPLEEAAKFQLYRPSELEIAPGERIRITRGGKTADGRHRLENGDYFTVQGFDGRGDLLLANGWKVPADYGHLDYGYVVTSHAAQGRTVDHVIVGQSWESVPAASAEQFYVSVSRGRKSAAIYTDNKRELLHAIATTVEEPTATDLARQRAMDQHRLEVLEQTAMKRTGSERAKESERER